VATAAANAILCKWFSEVGGVLGQVYEYTRGQRGEINDLFW
jgi:hypothetical protein